MVSPSSQYLYFCVYHQRELKHWSKYVTVLNVSEEWSSAEYLCPKKHTQMQSDLLSSLLLLELSDLTVPLCLHHPPPLLLLLHLLHQYHLETAVRSGFLNCTSVTAETILFIHAPAPPPSLFFSSYLGFLHLVDLCLEFLQLPLVPPLVFEETGMLFLCRL